MAWQTPEQVPQESITRTLVIPDDPIIVANVTGALFELTLESNWEKLGAIEPEQMSQIMTKMYVDYLNS